MLYNPAIRRQRRTTVKTTQQQKETITISARLTAYVRAENEGGYFAYCPVLDVGSQGDTVAEAKKNIAEAALCFVDGCYEMGTLDKVLSECGFKIGGKTRAKKPAGNWKQSFPFHIRQTMQHSAAH